MDNVQKRNICINVASSHHFRSFSKPECFRELIGADSAGFSKPQLPPKDAPSDMPYWPSSKAGISKIFCISQLDGIVK
jgi:hypothetical protein